MKAIAAIIILTAWGHMLGHGFHALGQHFHLPHARAHHEAP